MYAGYYACKAYGCDGVLSCVWQRPFVRYVPGPSQFVAVWPSGGLQMHCQGSMAVGGRWLALARPDAQRRSKDPESETRVRA